jgi:hypothetical protein
MKYQAAVQVCDLKGQPITGKCLTRTTDRQMGYANDARVRLCNPAQHMCGARSGIHQGRYFRSDVLRYMIAFYSLYPPSFLPQIFMLIEIGITGSILA